MNEVECPAAEVQYEENYAGSLEPIAIPSYSRTPTRVYPARQSVRSRGTRYVGATIGASREWECPICAATAQPHSLHPCGHSICVNCYERIEETGTPPVKKCPTCNKHIKGAAKNFALIEVIEGRTNLGNPQNIHNSIQESMGWRSKQERRVILTYSAFLAGLIANAKKGESLVISVIYTWGDLEAYFIAKKVEIHNRMRLNVHPLFASAAIALELPERHQHVCIEVDKYEIEIVQ
jgi:hypothetical protein